VAQGAVSLDIFRANNNIAQFNLIVIDLWAASYRISTRPATTEACIRAVIVHEVFMRYGENVCAFVNATIFLIEKPHSFWVSEYE
jgi:hypothetical protein